MNFDIFEECATQLLFSVSRNLSVSLNLILEAVMVGEAAMVAPGGVDNHSRWSYYARHEWLLQVNTGCPVLKLSIS